MKQIVIDNPCAATERMNRWAELEEMIVALQELGWRLEKYTQTDESGEPLRAFLRISHDAETSIGGLI